MSALEHPVANTRATAQPAAISLFVRSVVQRRDEQAKNKFSWFPHPTENA